MRELVGALVLMFLLLQLNVLLHEQAHASVCGDFGGCVSAIHVNFFWEYSYVTCNGVDSELFSLANSAVEVVGSVLKVLIIMFVILVFVNLNNGPDTTERTVPRMSCPFWAAGRNKKREQDPAQRELNFEGGTQGTQTGVRVADRQESAA